MGNVIIIKFSRFYKRDLPNLVYLEHLVGKYREKGVFLIFINSLGKHNSEDINRICNLSSPIIEDDGFISGSFNAGPEDTVIVDRNFTIKFMSKMNYIFNKSLIYNEVMKWTFEGSHRPQDVSNEELASIINQLSFYDVIEGKEKHLNKQISGRKIILTIFTSSCTSCEENYRIQLLREVSSRIKTEQTQIIILFGIGNNTKVIRRFALINSWDELPITVGVINDLDKNRMNNYYKLYQLNIDPITFIFNKKEKIIFAENFKNSRLIKLNFLMRKK